MAFIEWLQINYVVILEVLGTLIGLGTAITGFFSGERAEGVRAGLLKVSHFFSAVSPADVRGSLSVPFTTINIVPKEPVE
jgi:hypothetical protein